jgi:multiple sugar transport system permease protein
MMIPQEMLIITNFMTVAKLGWMNSYQALILPYCVNAFNIFLLRQTILQIQEDLYTAARYRWAGKLSLSSKGRAADRQADDSHHDAAFAHLDLEHLCLAEPHYDKRRLAYDLQRLEICNLRKHRGLSAMSCKWRAATLVTVPLIIIFVCLRKYIFAGIQRLG